MENKRKPFFEFIKKLLRLFKRRPRVINENKSLDDVAIYLSNHSAASGPLIYELYFPKAIRFWGTHEMCGSLGMQWKYLSTTYYHDKKHLPKWLAKIVATIVCPFVHGFYRGVNILPTYTDSRLRSTLKESFEVLDSGRSIFVFPEDSSDGYHDVLKQYFAGFYVLARQYYRKTSKNLKIYNMYYSRKKRTLIIKKATTYLDLTNLNKTDEEISEMMHQQANEMYEQILYESNKNNKKE